MARNIFTKVLTQKQELAILVVLVFLAAVSYGGYRYYLLNEEFKSTSQAYEEHILGLNENLKQERNENEDLLSLLRAEEERVNTFAAQFGEVKSTVGTLEKLSKTDPQLLQKYSKVYFLNENYVPAQLSTIDTKYLYDKKKTDEINTLVLPYLEKLINAAVGDNATLEVISAFRSFGDQSSLKSSYRVTYGTGANKFSADQGYSEHQLGTAVDFTTPKVGATFSGFEKTPEYVWLTAHAYQYGFVLSYPEKNKFYVFEPWHWRFVGVALATRLHNEGKYFYDLDQREIEKYLVNIFD